MFKNTVSFLNKINNINLINKYINITVKIIKLNINKNIKININIKICQIIEFPLIVNGLIVKRA